MGVCGAMPKSKCSLGNFGEQMQLLLFEEPSHGDVLLSRKQEDVDPLSR